MNTCGAPSCFGAAPWGRSLPVLRIANAVPKPLRVEDQRVVDRCRWLLAACGLIEVRPKLTDRSARSKPRRLIDFRYPAKRRRLRRGLRRPAFQRQKKGSEGTEQDATCRWVIRLSRGQNVLVLTICGQLKIATLSDQILEGHEGFADEGDKVASAGAAVLPRSAARLLLTPAGGKPKPEAAKPPPPSSTENVVPFKR